MKNQFVNKISVQETFAISPCDKHWHQKGKIKMRSDIETLTAYSDKQFLVGPKDGNLVMFAIGQSCI